MRIEQGVMLHNEFKIEQRDAVTGELKQEGRAHNIILNQLYDRLCSANTRPFRYIRFGTGSGTRSVTRTSLFTDLGYKEGVLHERGYSPSTKIGYLTLKIVLNPEEYVGSVFTEIGFAYGTASTNLVNHALIEDSEGNPISISKTALDVITIYGTIYIQLNELNGGLEWPVLDGTENIPALVKILCANDATPLFNTAYIGTLGGSRYKKTATIVYDTANKRVKLNTRFGVTEGNGAIKELVLGTEYCLNMYHRIKAPTTLIPLHNKTAEFIGTGDGVNKYFNTNFGFIKPGSLKIYVDGVETTTFSAKYDYPHPTDNVWGYTRAIYFSSDPSLSFSSDFIELGYGNIDVTSNILDEQLRVKHIADKRITDVGIATIVAALDQYSSVEVHTRNTGETEFTLRATATKTTAAGNAFIDLSTVTMIEEMMFILKAVNTSNSGRKISFTSMALKSTPSLIEIDPPPVDGAIVTADYSVEGFLKDSDHVLDVEFVITFADGNV